MGTPVTQRRLFQDLPERVRTYPQLRFMGSKFRLLPWMYEVLAPIEFHTALDPFCGSGCVAYLLKAMGKQVTASDFLNFSVAIARATVENSTVQPTGQEIGVLMSHDASDWWCSVPVSSAPMLHRPNSAER